MTKADRATLGLWIGLMALALWWTINHTSVRSDLSLFLPAGVNPIERLLLDELNQGPATRLLLLAIEGGGEDQRVSASRELASRLRHSELFSRVENGVLSADAIQQKPLFEQRYLLSSRVNVETFSSEQLKQSLETRFRELQSPLPSPFKPLISADPTGEYQYLIKQWLPQSRPHLTQGVWSSEGGERTLLLAETRAGAFSIDVQQQAVALIEQSFQGLDEHQDLQLIISGPGAFAIQSRSLIQQETRNLSLFASAGVMLLLLLAYGSKRYLIIAILPLASALLAGVLVTSLWFGELHGITLAFGITLLGITLDYPLHLFSHLRPGELANQAVSRIWRTLSLGVITTCIGYLALVTTDFSGLQQLGVFTLAGLIAATLSTRLVLPLLISSQVGVAGIRGERFLRRMLQPLPTLRTAVVIAGLLAGGSLLYSVNGLWQDDIGSLTPTSPALIVRDREIRAQLKAPEPHQLVIINHRDLESGLQACERLDQLLQTLVQARALVGYDPACRYLPSSRSQTQRRDSLPAPEVIEPRLATALEGLPFRKDGFKPFADGLEVSRRMSALTLEDLHQTPPGLRLETLIRERDGEWLLLTPLNQVEDEAAIARLLEQQLPSARYLNLRTETSRLVAGFRQQIVERLAIAAAVMLLVLAIGLKSLRLALRTMLPVLLALVMTAGLLHWMGVALTLFHLVSLMLVLGIGLDYSLFFGRREADTQASVRTLHALFICAMSTSAVFGILGSSDIPVLQAIGRTVAIGVVFSFIATLTLSRSPDKIPS